ncbi:unnamed protein product [Blepharisma stoltei]|uniref:histidine kinase n=1 Tax=Blepharisma stoltei TaxID=1481888 RepID=A0AAU9JEN0_9CILI|nr:unnamed protein product [Blepharisma stoltei]
MYPYFRTKLLAGKLKKKMTEIQELWWAQEIENLYKLLERFSVFSTALSFLFRFFCFFWYFEYFSHSSSITFPIASIFSVGVVKYFSNKSVKCKALVLLLYSETLNFLFRYEAKFIQEDQKQLLETIAFLVVLLFQLALVRNKLYFNILLLKYMYIWFVSDLFIRNEQDVSFYYCQLMIIIICFINVLHSHSLKISFERFISRNELETSKNRLNTIKESFSDGIIIISQDLKIQFYNPRVLQILATTPDNLFNTVSSAHYIENRKVSNFIPTNELIVDISYLLNNSEQNEIVLGITQIGLSNLEWRAMQIEWENLKAVFLTVRNVNHLIELEKKVACDQMKTLLLRSVSHELRTPLNSILHFTEDLIKGAKEWRGEEAKKLKMIYISGQQMLSLISDLLDYSQILIGVFSVHKTYCNLREIVQNVCELFKFQIEKKNLFVTYRIDPSLPDMIYTDHLRFSQILLNLLSNAIKYTLEGKIEITCILTSKNSMKCYIEDTGIGIEESAMKNMFRFMKTSNVPNLGPKGNGIGLYISNLLSRQLGNKSIKVKSSIGKGSVFYFKVDIFENFSPSEILDKIESNDNENILPISIPSNYIKKEEPKDVLIVDDTEFNLEILSSILTSGDVKYDEASNGKEAVEKVLNKDNADQPYKLIVMDCEMPEMNGWEASRYINQLYRQGKIKYLPHIVGYSAYCSDEDIKLCYQSGMVEFLPKPCSPDKILNTLKKFYMYKVILISKFSLNYQGLL